METDKKTVYEEYFDGIVNDDGSVSMVYEFNEDDLIALPIGLYSVAVDLQNDKVVVTNGCMKDSYWKIAEFALVKSKVENRKTAKAVKREVKKLSKMTKGRVAEKFGRKVAEKAPVWMFEKNGYNKSTPIRWYLYASLDYLYGDRKERGKLKIQPLTKERIEKSLDMLRAKYASY